jgi:hypothetical protein
MTTRPIEGVRPTRAQSELPASQLRQQQQPQQRAQQPQQPQQRQRAEQPWQQQQEQQQQQHAPQPKQPQQPQRGQVGGVRRPELPGAISVKKSTGATPSRAAHSAGCCCTACTGLQCLDRTRFFSGQLLTESDLNNEQSYLLAKNRLHNRLLHGWGVVCGLQVTCSDCAGWVTINPGYAIDPCGNDIIVCAAQSFNVLQAIQTCCTPKQTTDCSPLRYSPAATCQDVVQTWCITIQYQEQQSSMVTPLQQTTSSSGICACGGGSAKSSCGCGGNGNFSGSCSSTSATTTTTTTAAACQATRIIEGFQLGVCQTPSSSQASGSQPATFAYQFAQCYHALHNLIRQRPTLTNMSDQQAYQATCQYLTTVKNAIASVFVTHCQLESALYAIQIPPPSPNQPTPDTYQQNLKGHITRINDIIFETALDCLCSSLLPPCPPDPCDNRLILACVTVQNGAITNICHFGGGRQQVVTFPVLNYWLSLFGFDNALNSLGHYLELICCGEKGNKHLLFSGDVSARDVLLSGSSGNGAVINRAMISYVAQRLGAEMVNTASPSANAVDLRPLVGVDEEKATQTFDSWRIPSGNITRTDISALPEWNDAAIAAAAANTPAAFNASAPLTMYTRNKLVVGFDVTSPTDVLSNQVATLQQQVSTLSAQIDAMRNPQGSNLQQP